MSGRGDRRVNHTLTEYKDWEDSCLALKSQRRAAAVGLIVLALAQIGVHLGPADGIVSAIVAEVGENVRAG